MRRKKIKLNHLSTIENVDWAEWKERLKTSRYPTFSSRLEKKKNYWWTLRFWQYNNRKVSDKRDKLITRPIKTFIISEWTKDILHDNIRKNKPVNHWKWTSRIYDTQSTLAMRNSNDERLVKYPTDGGQFACRGEHQVRSHPLSIFLHPSPLPPPPPPPTHINIKVYIVDSKETTDVAAAPIQQSFLNHSPTISVVCDTLWMRGLANTWEWSTWNLWNFAALNHRILFIRVDIGEIERILIVIRK